MVRGTGEVNGINFKGIPAYHDASQGKERGNNTILCFQVDYEGPAGALSSRNRKFKQIWTNIQESRTAKYPPLRVPGHTDLELETYPSYSDVNDDLLFLVELKAFIPDVFDQLLALEQLLEQLNDDFSSDQIYSFIKGDNHCKYCP
ncbi:hypothetical protein ACFLYL_01665 [Chloroflexota bacterium]